MRNYFCGWYFKCQSDSQTLAVIPAFHRTKEGRGCSIQLITEHGSWNVSYPYSAFRQNKSTIEIAGNRFGKQALALDIHSPGLTATGAVRFSAFTPVKYDMMGPFRFVPFMECRHSVFSMRHCVTGELHINGTPYVFRGGTGYLEGDRGRSFPKEYAWTQCNFEDGSLMLSVADIPLAGRHFTGIIGAVLLHGREYRLATYLGAKALRIQDGEIIVRQGRWSLAVKQMEKVTRPLRAPLNGAMDRTIHEHPSCKVRYRFCEGGNALFAFEAPNAAFEYEYHI